MTVSVNAPRFVVSQSAVSCDFGDDIAILDLAANVYYSLNPVGAFIWDLLRTPLSLDDISGAVAEAFEVDRLRCENDVNVLIGALSEAGLVQVDAGSG